MLKTIANLSPQHDPDILTLTLTRSYDIRDLQLVGNYALQIWWDDSHGTGLYTWKYLRRMCMCQTCTTEQATLDK